MKVFQINSFGNLSTGRIAVDLYRTLLDHGHEGVVAYGRGKIADDVYSYRIGNKISVRTDGIMSRIADRAGFYSANPTKKLINFIKEYDPDIIHLHNLHGYYINIELLFNYLKASGKPVVWTLHDCWSFTGHCCYFDFAECEKWKSGCNHCPQIHEYPASFFRDNSEINYQKKKELFSGFKNLVIITPSKWLADLVAESYMQIYPVNVIYNGVDLNVFKPTYGNWTRNHNLEYKKIVLGVAGKWSRRKGLQDIIKLSALLPENYKVVVVGVDDNQLRNLPSNVLGIKRTYNSRELAEIYTSSHVFINATYEDNFPNVNIEALACGTPVITYNTGGSPEAINEKNGFIVPQGDITALFNAVTKGNFFSDDVLESSQTYACENKFAEYLNVYEKLI